MNWEHENVESMLGEMRLRQPSSQLDQSVSELLGKSNIEAQPNGHDGPSIGMRESACPPLRNRRFGTLTLITMGIVASLAGFLMGQFVDLKPLNQSSGQAVANSANSKLTPVCFNQNAFALLHGHSTKSEFSNCKDCHSTDGEMLEKYQDWFYGDSDLFEHHPESDVSDCSKCHTFGDSPKPEPRHPNSNCSACHLVGSSLPEPDAGASPSIEEG